MKTRMEKQYFRNYEYNTARMLTELDNLIVAKGGTVEPYYKQLFIIDRTLLNNIKDYEKRINELTDAYNKYGKENTLDMINNLKQRIKKLESVPNEWLEVKHTSYITFKLDNMYYYMQIDENPFVDNLYQKAKIVDNKRESTYLQKMNIKDIIDYLYGNNLSNEEIKKVAERMLKTLQELNTTEACKVTEKKRVANTYNNGYHYETVTKKHQPIELGF